MYMLRLILLIYLGLVRNAKSVCCYCIMQPLLYTLVSIIFVDASQFGFYTDMTCNMVYLFSANLKLHCI